jgi:hypothetical protein
MQEPGAPVDPRPRLSEREIIAILDSYQEAAISTRSSRLSRERGQALEYYNMEPYGDETRRGSKVVTSEVFDTDKSVEFVPEGPEDIEGADQKTKYANYIFYRENNGFNVLYEAIKDGLIMKNGVIKVYPEVNKSVRFSSFQGLTEMQAAMLADEEGVEFVGANWEVQEDGTPLYDLEIKHVSDDIKIRVEAVAPEEFSVVAWHKSVLLEDCDFMQHRTRVSVTRLREMGLVGNDEDVTDLGGAGFDEDDSSEEELARDEEIDEQRVFRENNPLQKEMWRVVVNRLLKNPVL